jgi:hypothetical protein
MPNRKKKKGSGLEKTDIYLSPVIPDLACAGLRHFQRLEIFLQPPFYFVGLCICVKIILREGNIVKVTKGYHQFFFDQILLSCRCTQHLLLPEMLFLEFSFRMQDFKR